MMEVVENKNAGNGNLTDAVSPEEMEPLRKRNNAFAEEMIDVGPDGELDRVSRLSIATQNMLDNWAYKLKLTPRKALVLVLLLGFLTALLFMIVVILGATWPKDYASTSCDSPTCHQFSAKVLSSLNQSASPCEDVWEFGCGGWLSRNPIPRSRAYWSTEQVAHFQLKEKLRNIITTIPYTEELGDVDMKLSRFYETCIQLEYIESEQEKPLKRAIKSLGGWQVFRTFRPQEFDFPRLLSKLQGDWRTSPFFSLDVVPDPQGPSRNIIKISPAGLTLPDAAYYFRQEEPQMMGLQDCSWRRCSQVLGTLKKFYKEQHPSIAAAFRTYAKDVLQLLGAPSNTAFQTAGELFYFERRIAEVTPTAGNVTDPIKSTQRVTVGRLRSQSNTIFWSDLLRSVFPLANIQETTEVLVVSDKYLEEISAIISTTDKGNLNNYLMWRLTHQYLPYLSKPFRDVREIFRKAATGSFEAVPRWEFCIDESKKFFPHVFNHLLARECDDRENKTAKIEAMFEHMKSVLFERFDSGLKYNESMKNFVLDKLRLMSVQVGTPIKSGSLLNDMYISLNFQKYEFFQNVQYATEYQLTQLQRLLATPNKEARVNQASIESWDRIVFSSNLNKVFVPESFLQKEVLLLDSSHLPILYGEAGIPLGEAIASAFGIERGMFSSNGALLAERDPKVQETRDLIESKRGCLVTFFNLIRLDDEPYIEKTSLDTLIHLAGIQLAFDTLKSLENEQQLSYLPSLYRFSHDGLFFISYLQSECSSQTLLFHQMEHETFKSLSHDHRTRGVLRQLVPFTEAFSCSSRSEMYADFSCGYAV